MKLEQAQSSSSSEELLFAEGADRHSPVPHDPVAKPFDYFAIYRQFPFSIVLYDLDGRCVMVNDAFKSQWGFNVDEFPFGYSVLRDPQLEKAGVMPLIRRAFAGEIIVLPPVQYDRGILLDARSQMRWVRGTLSPVFDKDHHLIQVMLMHTDLSLQVQQQLAEEPHGDRELRLLREIRQSSLDYYALYEQLPFSAVTLDPAGRPLVANMAYTREWGITIDQLPVNYSILNDAQLKASGVMHLVQRAFAGEAIELPPLQYDIGSLVSGASSSRWFRAIFHPVRDERGTLLHVLLIHTDITEQVNTRLAMDAQEAQEERRIRETLECTTDSVIQVDHNWTYTYLNRRAVEMVSVGRELLGKNMWEEFPDAVNGKMWAEYQKAMYERVPGETEEYYGAPLNKWLHVRAFPTAEGIAIFFQDITARVHSEKALRDSEKLAIVGRLAAAIAHEIKNPLECVADLLHLLQGEPDMPQSALQYIGLAQQELQRMSLISVNTLEFVRHATKPSQASLVEIINSVLTLFHGRLKLSGTRIATRYRDHEPLICYAAELRQVLANFIANALDATPSGGILHLRVRPTRLGASGDLGIIVTIADTGSGMSAHTISHLYDAFFTTKQVIGTGLGLWVSGELIQKHGGRVRVRSRQSTPAIEPGAPASTSGTVFQITFPYRNNFLVEP